MEYPTHDRQNSSQKGWESISFKRGCKRIELKYENGRY